VRFTVIVMFALAAVTGFAQDDAATLYAPFDGGLEPALAAGSGEVTVEGTPHLPRRCTRPSTGAWSRRWPPDRER